MRVENHCLCFRRWSGLGNRERAWSPQIPGAETSDHSLIKKKDRMCQIDFQATHTISAPLWNGAAKAPQTYTPLREPLLYANPCCMSDALQTLSQLILKPPHEVHLIIFYIEGLVQGKTTSRWWICI